MIYSLHDFLFVPFTGTKEKLNVIIYFFPFSFIIITQVINNFRSIYIDKEKLYFQVHYCIFFTNDDFNLQ